VLLSPERNPLERVDEVPLLDMPLRARMFGLLDTRLRKPGEEAVRLT